MPDDARTGATPAVPLLSVGLVVLAVALVGVGLPVMVAPGATDRYFAWTIDVPLTAAFLGACYWTAAAFTILSARARTWACARVVMPGILVAGTLILAATLVHLDRFAMDAARGWIWLILYGGLVPGTLLLLALQRRAGHVDPPVLRPVGRGASGVFAGAGVALLALGAALFAVPQESAGWWPWPLTELTARMVGAWLAALGVTLLAARRAGDWTRLSAAMAYVALLSVAQVATLARYPDSLKWEQPRIWFYIAACAALLALAVHGLRERGLRRGAPQARAAAMRGRAGA